MFGVEEEVGTGTDGVLGENSETNSDLELGLVLSEEDTTEGISVPDEKSWNTKQVPQRARIQIPELEEYQYNLGRLHCVVPNQSTDYVGLTSQV